MGTQKALLSLSFKKLKDTLGSVIRVFSIITVMALLINIMEPTSKEVHVQRWVSNDLFLKIEQSLLSLVTNLMVILKIYKIFIFLNTLSFIFFLILIFSLL